MTLKTKNWDPAERLQTEEQAQIYVAEFVRDGSVEELVRALQDVAQARGMALIAERAGLTAKEIYEIVNPFGGPQRPEVIKLLTKLGLSAQGAKSDAA